MGAPVGMTTPVPQHGLAAISDIIAQIEKRLRPRLGNDFLLIERISHELTVNLTLEKNAILQRRGDALQLTLLEVRSSSSDGYYRLLRNWQDAARRKTGASPQ